LSNAATSEITELACRPNYGHTNLVKAPRFSVALTPSLAEVQSLRGGRSRPDPLPTSAELMPPADSASTHLPAWASNQMGASRTLGKEHGAWGMEPRGQRRGPKSIKHRPWSWELDAQSSQLGGVCNAGLAQGPESTGHRP